MDIRTIILPLLLAIAFSSTTIAAPQAPLDATAFHDRVVDLYSFAPHTLNSEQIQSKSVQLDQFWNEVRDNSKEYLPFIRDELRKKGASSFFLYDGSKLLLLISEEKQDLALALASIPKADLKDVQGSDYLRTVHWFAMNGYDTTAAALRVLDYPEFKATIPLHALTLGQDYSLIYMLFPQPDTKFIQPLIDRLSIEKDIKSQKSIMLALWYTVTPEATLAIQNFSNDASRPEESRNHAKELIMQQSPQAGKTASSDIAALKKKRQLAMHRISDEALIRFEEITAKLIGK